MRRLIVLVLGLLFSVLPGASVSDSGFEQATDGRILVFPRDHGKHPDFQTEWWYFTGNVQSGTDRNWGFQLTFFRRAIAGEPARKESSWGVRDLYPAHFALTDVKGGRFYHAETISREGPNLARSASDKLMVKVKNWTAEQNGNEIRIKARQDGYAIDLLLVPLKPVVLHGRSGYSVKGDDENQASYYYSFTRLEAGGTLTFDGNEHNVKGFAWMDHEFGSSIISKDQSGWDWFSLQLDDGTELTAFRLRKKNGTPERAFATFVEKDGTAVPLSGKDVLIRSVADWKSPRTKAVYPSRWMLEIPSKRITIEISPFLEDQELVAEKSTGTVYWEGAVTARADIDGREVQAKGYVELTGYAHSMEGKI